ncbi:MAG: dihydroxyacetone kinase subunit L [Alistipes sp.]|nr:dihydroxyacetone kinase subunit L [Alistipes sp.]
MENFTGSQAAAWIEGLKEIYDANKDYLTELDREIGDSDHGNNMARGFDAVATKVEAVKGSDLGTIFKTTAMKLISTVGGASGPLYGTFFLQLAAKTAGKTGIGTPELAEALKAGLDGVAARGKAVAGDKTMIDAMMPAVDVFLRAGADDTLSEVASRAADAAREGAEGTVPLVARKGRASYLGERSAGYKDPGAESTALMFRELATVLAR